MSNEDWAVYCIRNRVNGKVYVGGTTQWQSRKISHKKDLNTGSHHSVSLQADWAAFGGAVFEFTVLETVAEQDPAALTVAEQRWIDALGARDSAKGYNKVHAAHHSWHLAYRVPPVAVIDPPPVPLSRVAIPMPVDLIARVDDYRFTNRIPSRAAAIRELLETALTVKTKDQSK